MNSKKRSKRKSKKRLILEALLDKKDQSISPIFMADISNFAQVSFQHYRRNQEKYFIKFLTSKGVPDWAKEILLYKFVDDFTYEEIAKELGYTSRKTAKYAINKAMNIIKERVVKKGRKYE